MLKCQNLRERVDMLKQVATHGLHHAATLNRAQIRERTRYMHALRSHDRAIHVTLVCKRMFCQFLPSAGVEHVDPTRAAIDPRTVNVVLPICLHTGVIRC